MEKGKTKKDQLVYVSSVYSGRDDSPPPFHYCVMIRSALDLVEGKEREREKSKILT